MQALWQDIRYGLRMLAKSPGFTAVALLTLALGIGANTAIFSIVNAVLLRPLPYPESERIVQIGFQTRSAEPQPAVTIPQFEFLRDHGALVFDSVAGFQPSSTLELKQRGKIDWIRVLRVTADFFPVLGVHPVLGRGFTRAETQPGAPLSIILSDSVWRRTFGASLEIIGTQVKLSDHVYTVVGVLPDDFTFLENPVDAFVPLQPSNSLGDRGMNTSAIARLKPGVNLTQAQTQMAVLFPQVSDKNANFLGLEVFSYQRMLTGDIRPSLLVLFGAVGLLLLIACINVASLMLARTTTRRHEISIRLALGAGPGRLLQQFLAESLLMGMIAGCAGLVAAFWTLDALGNAIPWSLHAPSNSIRMDGAVLAFTLGIALLTGILFGLVSLWQTTRVNLVTALRVGPTTGSSGSTRGLIRNVLVVSEIALSLMLLVGAALLAESLYHLHQEKLGFDPSNVVKTTIAHPSSFTGERIWALQQQLLARIQALPGVSSAAVVTVAPLAGQANIPTQLVGYDDPQHSIGGMEIRAVSERYFETMRIPVLHGRGISDSDGAASSLVAVVNETLARRWWKDKSPIGDQIVIGKFMGRYLWHPVAPAREIVGVVGDVKGMLLTRAAPPMIYVPASQAVEPTGGRDWVIRTAYALDLGPTLRRSVSEVDPELRITDLRPMSTVIATTFAGQRFDALVLGLFAAVALLLASVGIYGVLSLYVNQRTHEIGVRMALGAKSRQVLRLVMGQGLLLALIGVAIGVPAAVGLTRFLRALLYGVHATSITSYAVGSFIVVIVAMLASYIPARRAMRVDPIVALRYE